MNRAGYAKETFDAFKESGGIEYGADVAAILKTEEDGTSSDTSRSLTLHIIKNRNGELANIAFDYRPDIPLFTEGSKSERSYLDSFKDS